MDDCVEHVSEQIALDGAVGTSLDRIWEFVLAFFRVQGKATVIDDNMKSYLWARLLRKRCLRVWAQDRGDTRLLTQNVENLTSLRSAFGNRLLVTASESSQWLTLTGHPMDSSVRISSSRRMLTSGCAHAIHSTVTYLKAARRRPQSGRSHKGVRSRYAERTTTSQSSCRHGSHVSRCFPQRC